FADGTGNWPVWTTFTYEIVDLLGIDFENTTVHISDEESGQRHEVVLDRLLSGIARETPLTIDLKGRLNGQPLSHTLTGPSFADLDGDSMWPLAGELRLATTRLNLKGTAGSAEEVPIFDIEYMIHSDELGELAAAAGAESMEIGSLDLAGHVAGAANTYKLTDLAGKLGATEFEASLELDLTADIPVVGGRIAIGHLDVSPWVEGDRSQPDTTADAATGIDNLLKALEAVNAHLAVAVDRLSLPDTDLDNLEIEIDIEDGVLSVPIELRLGSSPVRGVITAEEDDGQLRLALDLGSRAFDLGLFGGEEVGGSIGRLSVDAESRGSAVNDLVDNLQFKVRGNNLAVTVQDADDGVFEIPIRSVVVVQNPGTGVWATARGRHKDTPFTIEVATANLMKLLDGVTLPVNITARGSGATATVRGRVRPTSTAPRANLRFGVEGDAIGDLSPWTGLSPDAAMPYLVKGRLDTMHGPPRMVIEDGRIGRSSASAELSMTDGDHVIVARIDAPLIDLEELATILPSTEAMTPENEMSISEKIVPTQVNLPDADVEILVGRVRHGDLDLDDISASLRSREGHLETSPFEFKWEEQPISGLIYIDLQSDRPEIDVFVSSRHLDEEDIEHGLDLESLPETSIGRVGIDLELRGATLEQLVDESYMSIIVDDARTVLAPADSEDSWEIVISHLQADALYGEPTRIAAVGFINGAPVDFLMNFAMADLETYARDGLPVHLLLRSKDTELDIEGNLVLPIDPKNQEFHVLLHGASLDDLNPLLGTDLPSLGPYSVDGRFTAAERNFDLSNLFIVFGDSTLQGNLGYFEGEERPIIVGRLASHRPRLEDFYLAPEDEDQRPAGAPQTSDTDGQEPVLDPELLRLVDLDLSFDVTGFEWGDRGPGAGEFRLQLDDGRLTTSVFWDQPNGGHIDATPGKRTFAGSYPRFARGPSGFHHLPRGPPRGGFQPLGWPAHGYPAARLWCRKAQDEAQLYCRRARHRGRSDSAQETRCRRLEDTGERQGRDRLPEQPHPAQGETSPQAKRLYLSRHPGSHRRTARQS
ncbi:MAG: hypothetical protein IFJ97_01415, partial [Acidobacteria bacterium]|nr:hypothetical protein [Candidatus Sulfomarinibacter kjeldsenii]